MVRGPRGRGRPPPPAWRRGARLRAAGVRALVVVSAGFAEIGREGRRRQTELLGRCRGSGMRLVGPNCLGVPQHRGRPQRHVRPAAPTPAVAFASQSGAFGIAAVAEAAGRGPGRSSFVSIGNKADLSGNDLLSYWDQDRRPTSCCSTSSRPATRGGSAGSPATWPPQAGHGGQERRSAWPRRAAASHTGALVAATTRPSTRCSATPGVIRADTVGELFDAAALLSPQAAAARGPGRQSSPTPAGPASSAPTPARPPGCASSRSRRTRPRITRRTLPAMRPSPTRST